MANFIGAIVVILIIALAVGYVIREKKRGVKCIGCPAGKSCSKGGCSSCLQNECKSDSE